MKYLSYTIYQPRHHGEDVTVGITVKPMPNLTLRDLNKIEDEIDLIILEMMKAGAKI